MKEGGSIRELYNAEKLPDEVFCTNEYGFVVDSFQCQLKDPGPTLKRQWYELLGKHEGSLGRLQRSRRARRLVYKGIPLSLKHRLWGLFGRKTINADYPRLVSMGSTYEHQIHVDVQRTFRRHFLFSQEYGRGQCELFNVLAAYSNHNRTVGYCQGMSGIAALLLMYFPEREAFEMLASVIESNGLEELFDKNLSKVPRIQAVQEDVFKITIPEIYSHLFHQNIDVGVCVISWYLTLFTRFDIRLVLRMWDLFLFMDFSVFLYFAAAILRFHGRRILELQGEALVEFVGAMDTRDVDVERIVSWAVEIIENIDYAYFRRKIQRQ
jgi:USP6 N-terminal-like protein